jgi:hypothetical protein
MQSYRIHTWDIDEMGQFVAAPSPPMAGASSRTLPLCHVAIVGVDLVVVHR